MPHVIHTKVFTGDMFDPENPCLSAGEHFEDIEKATAFQKFWCKESLPRVVQKGPVGASAVHLLCHQLRELVVPLLTCHC
eukprot:3493910-Amphidinium_carterae.1